MTRDAVLLRSAHAGDNGFSPRAGFRPFDPADAELTLGERFRATALRCGSRMAVSDGDAEIGYADLLARAEAVARDLRSRHGESGGIVAICLPPGVPAIEMMLGALLGGFGYFCLSPSLPEHQQSEQLKTARPVALIGQSIQGLAGQRGSGGAASVETHGPSGIAALYATSGSTGEPKLAAWSHRAILFDIGRQTNDLYLGPDDRFDSLFSLAFSASLATVFGALLNGAELHCHDPRHDLAALPAWLAARGITVSTMTVSMLRHLCLLRPPARSFARMRLLSAGGEALGPADVDAFRSVFPASCVLQNAMASTEARTYAQYFVPQEGPAENPVPIGWPVAGKEVLLVDEVGQPVPPGSEGEIAVRSRYLASGYFGGGNIEFGHGAGAKFQVAADGTALFKTGDRAVFRPDGSLIFLGRADTQAKIRGHRVELEHISRTIEMHPAIRAAAVVLNEDPDGNDRLVAYLVADDPGAAGEHGLRDFLRERLPDYAVPAAFQFLPKLPLNANFKLDRRRLPPLSPSPPERAGDALPAIEILRDIWRTVLQRPDIPDDQPFAALGGDSLSAVRVLVAILERFRCDLPPDSLHRFPTLSQLAALVDQAVRGAAPAALLIVFPSTGAGCPVFFVAGMGGSARGYESLAARMASLHPVYGLNTSSGFAATSALSVESTAARLAGEVQHIVPPGGKAVLVGYSFGGTVAFEMARILRGRGREALPLLIDMPAMNAPGRPPRTRGRRIANMLRNFPVWVVYEAVHFDLRAMVRRASGHLARVGRALHILPPSRKFDPRLYLGTAKIPEAYQAHLTSMYQALRAYAPGAYQGRIVLLRARTPTLFQTNDPQMGWQYVAAGGVEVHAIPGRHGDCMSAQHEPALAALLLRCMAEESATSRATQAPAPLQ